jgi:hypothetical protein
MLKDTTIIYKYGKSKDSTAVSDISFRKPGRINLKVENFNPFYWDAKITTFKRPVDEESGHIGMFLSSMTSALGLSGFPAISRGDGDPQVQKRLSALYIKLEESGTQLKELKFNIQKTEAVIKSEAQAIGADVMKLVGKNKLDIKEMRLRGKEFDDSLNTQLKKPFSELLPIIAKLYNEIMNTDYRVHYSIKGNADINLIKLQIYPRSDSLARENPMDTITKYFPMRDKAVLKLLNSVGFTFTYFSDNNTSYFIKPDLTIGSGTGDLFTPVISTFIHFLGNKENGFKVGGAFGFGIPLTGAKKDINFMLGLCTALGRNESVLISAGVAGTKVERLASGLKVGQTVPSFAYVIPIVSQFRPGAFFSLSFNLKKLPASKQE